MILIQNLQLKLYQWPSLLAVLALVSGALMSFSMAPFNYWYLSLISIVLFLFCLDTENAKASLLRFYLYAVGMFAAGVYWVYVSVNVHGGASEALAGFLIALFVLAISTFVLPVGWLYLKYLHRPKLGLVLGFSLLWMLKEWLYTWLFTGFPWLLTGYSQLQTPLAGYAPVFGVLGVGFLVALSSCLIYCILVASRGAQLKALICLAVIWSGGQMLRSAQWTAEKPNPISVSLVQGNIDQAQKWRRDMVWPIVRTYMRLSQQEWGRDIILWPEAAITLFREQGGDLIDELDIRGKRFGTSLIFGMPDRDTDGGFLNAAIGVGEADGIYYKRHLVPFGEYVPLESWLRGLIKLFDLPMSHNKPGPDRQTLLIAGDLKVAMVICYEIIFPALVRDNTQIPDILMTISNDTWFGESIGPLQHAQIAQMRALENGRYLLRATNNGLTAVIGPDGEVIAQLPQFEQGVLQAEVYAMVGVTPFANWGHKLLLLLISLTLPLLLLSGKVAGLHRDTQ